MKARVYQQQKNLSNNYFIQKAGKGITVSVAHSLILFILRAHLQKLSIHFSRELIISPVSKKFSLIGNVQG